MNARADFQQQQTDQERREEETLQALMTITKAGYHKEADHLAREAGVYTMWTAPIKTIRTFKPRPDGMPF